MKTVTMSELAQFISGQLKEYSYTEVIKVRYVVPMALGGYKTEGVKRFQVTPVLVADAVAAHGNETVDVVKTDYYDDDHNNFRHTLELSVSMEKCDYRLL
jgi:hypothetical protein